MSEEAKLSGIKELEAAALLNGIQDGAQMSRFLLWVGNECFEGREVQSFAVLTARAKELVQMFLVQDKDRHGRRDLEDGVKKVVEG